MKFKDVFPSARRQRGILFVRIADVLEGREYVDQRNYAMFLRGLKILRTAEFENYAISLRGLSYLSSQAIGYLVDFQRKLSDRGLRLLLYELEPKVRVVLQELGLDKYFDVYGLEGHVLRYFESGGESAPDGDRLDR